MRTRRGSTRRGFPSARRERRVRRRRIAAFGGVAAVVLAGFVVARALGINAAGARVIRFTIHSTLLHRAMPVVAVVPAGASNGRRPVVVFRHGKGENQDSNLDDAMFAALARLKSGAPDMVFPYGGADSYWHDRADGAWGSYVMREVIGQAVRRLHADPRRVAIGGISMGGFGALNLARLYPGRFCAVGAHSAALWVHGGDSAPGAFDGAQDFARNDVVVAARSRAWNRSAPVWVDVGTQDQFRSADTTLAGLLRADRLSIRFHLWPGSHDQAYWQSHWSSYLRFYAAALGRCHHA